MQRRGQIGHFFPIHIGQTGVQQNWWFFRRRIDGVLEFGFANLQHCQFILHAGVKHAIADGVDEMCDLALDLRQIALGFTPFLLKGPGKTVVLLLIGVGEFRDQIRVQQLLF
ncbi:hypothetical protein [Ruegeria sp. R14_0]|uniref:hypothetical protein n=1 Tax=Ruegeria sp. R14_0 TaxID=2821100 RepID=UPI0032AFA54F